MGSFSHCLFGRLFLILQINNNEKYVVVVPILGITIHTIYGQNSVRNYRLSPVIVNVFTFGLEFCLFRVF